MTRLHPATGEQTDRLRRALTGLVIEVFRLNGDLLAAGDALVGDLGLTSARWQVLGAVALSPMPLPVAHIARNMGLTRQAVQRSVDEMREDGFVRLEPNPHHRRAMLVTMTERGAGAYRAASERQGRWAEALSAGLPPEGIEAAGDLLREMQRRLGGLDTPAAAVIEIEET
ncbi:MarR family winged helix-turn-helix transcriptional regulator [Methylobacterium planeticum]|uniref:MarR family transcriptional regulator n=1 Tax=Methylobacterium planeticum TaxID=2615211 RepID=A0A6N6MUK9_9HYPH|nr:MarR family transcriptional regulator [Methylobacterium planeticum]KAB1073411.1 MarR family transcriptional regulator [Methylobacterium planeticum]